MPRFFVDKTAFFDTVDTGAEKTANVTEKFARIVGDDAFHIARSLRMAVGEHVTICDTESTDYECELEKITDNEVVVKIISEKASESEPPYYATLFQALPKGDKLDFIIQKSVECGAFAIIPFESERCIAKSKSDVEARKTERRNKIAAEAAKQCGRGIVPGVSDTVSFDAMLAMAAKCDIGLFCYEECGLRNSLNIKKVLEEQLEVTDNNVPGEEKKLPVRKKSIAVVIGSEGGFSEREAEKAKATGLIPVGLGKRILRTETAAVFSLACIAYSFDM